MATPDSTPPPPLPFAQPTHLLTSPFAVARPTPADLDAMTEVFVDAFARDPGNTYWWSPDAAAQAAWSRLRLRLKMSDPGVRYFKVVDHDAGDRLVAFARWDIPDRAARAFGEPFVVPVDGAGATGAAAKSTEKAAEPVPGVDYPEGANKALCVGFFDSLAAMSKKWDAAGMLGLSLLATSPQYFRRGAARALLQPMLAIADAEGLQTYLEATAGGKPVYEKLGFRQVDTLRFDLAQLLPGGARDVVVEITIMVRKPKGANGP